MRFGRKRIWAAAGVVIGILVLSSVTYLRGKQQMNRYSATFLGVFDTVTEVVGYADSEEEFTRQVALLKGKLTEYHRLYDIYHEYEGINNIKTVNDHAGVAPVQVDREIIDLLEYGRQMYEMTGGKNNIAMGSVLSIWHDYREEGNLDPEQARLPERELLEEAGMHTDMDQMIIDEEKSTVYLADKEMSLDVGSIGKGYAVLKTVEYAKSLGMERMLLSVGGNISAIGGKVTGESWHLGIQNPDRESEQAYVRTVEAKDVCVVTSGDYQRYYTVDGERYCHIIDPDTWMPARDFSSVTIIAPDSGTADGLTTAVFCMSYQEGRKLIAGMEEAEAMWIFTDGSIRYSDGFEGYIVK